MVVSVLGKATFTTRNTKLPVVCIFAFLPPSSRRQGLFYMLVCSIFNTFKFNIKCPVRKNSKNSLHFFISAVFVEELRSIHKNAREKVGRIILILASNMQKEANKLLNLRHLVTTKSSRITHLQKFKLAQDKW